MRMSNILLVLSLSAISLSANTVFYDSGNPPQGSGLGLFSDEWIAQSFVANEAWQMGILGVFAGGTQPITMALAEDVSGLPGPTLGSWTINKTDWDPGGSWGYTDAIFAFTQGTKYWFEYASTADFFDGDLLPVPAPNGNPDIAFSFDQGTTWVIGSGVGPVGLRIEAPAGSEVPEPAPWPLLTAALTAMGMASRRRVWKRH